jgi:hypothetical protein
MKKSSLLIITILLALSAIAVYFYKHKSGATTLDKEASNFPVKDTASIDKIFMADKEGKSVLLERTKEGWMLDKKYHVRPDAITLLLYTIKMVEVQSPISMASKKNVIKIMSSKSTKIEIYSKGEKIKQYYIGHTTQDHLGTYMLLTNLETRENYTDPFVTHIPGFDGFLTTRYNTDELDWRDRLVMSFRPPQLKQIKLELHEMPDSSFVLDLFSMQRFGLKTRKGSQIPFDEAKLKQYIAYFQNVNCEVVLQKNDHLVDSLGKSAIPFATLTINNRNDQQFVCDFFHKQPIQSKNEQYGVNYKYDPDRLFIRYNNGKDYGVAKFYVFGKILQTYRYFTKGK